VEAIYAAGIATGDATFETAPPSWEEFDASRLRDHRLVAVEEGPENAASLALHERVGFRVVGRRERIAQLGGAWRDTILLERRSPRVG